MKLSLAAPFLCLLSRAASESAVAPVCESIHPYSYDTGKISSPDTTVVSHKGAPWIQLDLSGTKLAPGARLILIGEKTSQHLDATTLGSSSNGYSAVFDGDSVSLELDTGGAGRGLTSRVAVAAVKVGLCEDDVGTEKSLCGDDDRRPSTDVRVGRFGGCTGWLIGEDTFITAGHCGTPDSSARIHFTFGSGNAPAEDQYAVDLDTYSGSYTGVGDDWGAARLLPNSVTGKLPGIAQSEKCGTAGCGWFTIGTVPNSPDGNHIRVTGYGSAAIDSRSQKTHVDDLTLVKSSFLRYIPDTTGGNSGSPVIHEETGHAVAVHTNGGCEDGGNRGMRVDYGRFAEHIDFLTKFCASDSQCDGGVCVGGKCQPCKNDWKGWTFTTHTGQDRKCGWVSRVPDARCVKVGNDGRVASDACPKSCGRC